MRVPQTRMAAEADPRVTRLEELGGRLWEKGVHKRVYFNNPVELARAALGLEVSLYNTGNISHALLNGEKISNSAASRYMFSLSNVYYDLVKGDWVAPHGGAATVEKLRKLGI